MHIFENEITLGNRPILDEYMNSYEYKTSGLSFSSMYMWRNINLFQWDIIGDYMCVTGLSHLELEDGISLPFLFPPLTRTGTYEKESLRETIYRCKEIFEKKGYPFSLRLVPIHMLDMIKEACPEIEFEDDRPNYDYIYLTEDLKNPHRREDPGACRRRETGKRDYYRTCRKSKYQLPGTVPGYQQ